MEWKSRRVEAILEQALAEDKATSDVTTALTIEPSLRAAATIIAKEECVLSGLGCIPRFLDIFARLDGKSSGRHEVISHPKSSTASAFAKVRPSPSFVTMLVSYWPANASSST